ncbi:hypothetical protein BGZ72_009455 [Mortierella alpina]|nr:hypothetical protein BGZ72_009455 [Mortierella alpina]
MLPRCLRFVLTRCKPIERSWWLDSFVSHFRPALDSPSASLQQTTMNNHSQFLQNATNMNARNSYVTPDSTRGVANASSQPATPSTPRTSTGRQTPGSGPGSGVPGAYHSVKAQDLPPYEEMIFMAIADLNQEAGSAPKSILDWVHDHYPVPDTFRASCGQAISKAAKKGRLLKEGSLYKLKPGYTYPRATTTRRRDSGAITIVQLGPSYGNTDD